MLITKLLRTQTRACEKRLQSKLDQCCAVYVQAHLAYCSVCKAVDGTHFVRNLKSGLA